MKIFTRTGDNGTTSLVGGTRLPKDNIRIETYGTVDELNAYIGLLTAYPKCPPEQRDVLIFVQQRLFNIGAYLANPTPGQSPVSQADVNRLENSIDDMERLTPPVNRFILPGGCTIAAQAHVARTVARRAERRIVTLATTTANVDPLVLAFINRLSDWFFEFARYNNVLSDTQETFWDENF